MKKFLPFLFLLVLVGGSYAPALRDGFVWDDTALVLRDPFIRSPRLIAEGFQHFLFTDATASNFYRPIQRLTYTLEYLAFGLTPAAYHLTNLLLQAAAACALYLFARELLRGRDGTDRRRDGLALVAAMIWAIHPVHSSAVVYISGRADPLAAAFGFSALYLAMRSFRVDGPQRWWLTLGSATLLLLGGLSKESGLIFLALYLGLCLRASRAARLPAFAAITVVLALYLSLRLPAEHSAPPPPHAVPVLVRPLLAARAVAEYAGLLALPMNLHMERDVTTHPNGFGEASITGAALRELETLAGLLLVAGYVAWTIREYRRDRDVFALLLLAAASYLPISGLLPLNATIAEHWVYVPSAFLVLAAAVTVHRAYSAFGGRLPARILVPALAAWMIFLSGRTFVRTFDWKDGRTFVERTIAHGGDSARMFINLAQIELDEDRLGLAKQHLTTALTKEPEQPFAIVKRAAVALREGDFATAHEMLGRALEMPLVEARAHEMLAVLEFKETGRSNLTRMRLASRTGAANWEIEKRYVKLLFESGANESALREMSHCLQTQWYRAESWQLAAQLAARDGQHAAAVAALERANAYDVRLAERPAPL